MLQHVVRRARKALWGETLYRLGRLQGGEGCLTRSYRELAADDKADRDAREKARERLRQFNIDLGTRDGGAESMLATKRTPAGST